MNYNREGWLDTVLSHVRCGPARREIREELSSHMEDKEQALLDAGIAPSDASRMAVQAMGDPDEVGRAMNQVHRPFWGVLYGVIKGLLAVLVLVLAFQLINGAVNTGGAAELLNRLSPGGKLPEITDLGADAAPDLAFQVQPVKLDGCTYRVEQARLFETSFGTYSLIVDIKVTNPLPWADPPMAVELLEIRDSWGFDSGNSWLTDPETGEMYPNIELEIGWLDGEDLVHGRIFDRETLRAGSWGTWRFRIYAHFPQYATWAEIYYPMDEALTFRFTYQEEAA
ncbi:MAG: permease prefix domain 1-containing protein [Oscillospiraceae bacterium]